jgi:hypothetical protein
VYNWRFHFQIVFLISNGFQFQSGCYGALKRKKWALVFYLVFVMLVMVSLAGVSWILFSSKDALHRIEEGKSSGNDQVCQVHGGHNGG